jgi:serpin B
VTAATWNTWLSHFNTTKVKLTMPKFKLEYEISLEPILTLLGMGIAFEPKRANFRGISAAPEAWLGRVNHKAFVEVKEEGTEAAAATSVEHSVILGGSPRPRIEEMIVNRPFFCVIRDNRTRAIVFMGSIVEPLWDETDSSHQEWNF